MSSSNKDVYSTLLETSLGPTDPSPAYRLPLYFFFYKTDRRLILQHIIQLSCKRFNCRLELVL